MFVVSFCVGMVVRFCFVVYLRVSVCVVTFDCVFWLNLQVAFEH